MQAARLPGSDPAPFAELLRKIQGTGRGEGNSGGGGEVWARRLTGGFFFLREPPPPLPHGCPRGFPAGLPAALPSLPLELAVLCNALPAEMRPPGGCPRRASAWIERGLRRGKEPGAGGGAGRGRPGLEGRAGRPKPSLSPPVLEACAATEEGLDSGDLWPRVLQQASPEELRGPLHHLAALQAASWLADHQLERARELLRLLSGAQVRKRRRRWWGCDPWRQLPLPA